VVSVPASPRIPNRSSASVPSEVRYFRNRLRARCRRDFTVPAGRPSAVVIAASSRSRKYQQATTRHCGSGSVRTAPSSRRRRSPASTDVAGSSSVSGTSTAANRAVAAAAPVGTSSVLRLVDHKPQQPRPELGTVLEPGERVVGLEERRLHHVLRIRAGAEEHRGPAGGDGIQPHEDGVGIPVAGAHLLDDDLLGDLDALRWPGPPVILHPVSPQSGGRFRRCHGGLGRPPGSPVHHQACAPGDVPASLVNVIERRAGDEAGWAGYER
jgi:hypothetical protein